MSLPSSPNLNSKYAWRELAGKGLPKRSASERVHDFLEIYGIYDEATAREQASRCLQCPNPTCVTGCPLCNPIPQWMQLTAEGKFLEAAALLGSSSQMAEVCTRLCPSDHLCEHTCILDGVSEPVSIRALEHFLIEYAFDHGQVDNATAPPNGRKVAVVGSGAGGLACADYLARRGFAVTVYDANLVPGGLLVNGVPAFKIEQSIVQRRVDLLKRCGVVFKVGLTLGKDITLTQLRTAHDAVFLGFDSRRSHPLDIPGAQLKGVVQALPFLLQKTTPLTLDMAPVEVSGKRVVVIGGGDTAMDCLRTALRWGAASATGVYRRDEDHMSCSREAYLSAVEEGAEFIFRAAPEEVLGTGGTVSGLRLVRTQAIQEIDATGRQKFEPLADQHLELSADWVVPALGFDPVPCTHEDDFASLHVNDWGGLIVDDNGMTNVPGVFAAGDIVQGTSTVLGAVRDARKAAEAIAEWLVKKP